jgi:uncharacterized membrane protein
MTTAPVNTIKENIFLRMHPLHRVGIALGLSVIVYFFIRQKLPSTLFTIITMWDVFALTLVVTSWIVLLTRSTTRIRELATREDVSVFFIFVLILVASFASMFTVLLLIISKEGSRASELLYLFIAVSGMLLSWIMVHSIFTFHYAHMYYDNDKTDPKKHAAGLDFPNEKSPDYLDFAYFAFVIGMTFQVSDVEISSRRIRRLALIHGLISFGLNTFVVALTINIIAGLKH